MVKVVTICILIVDPSGWTNVISKSLFKELITETTNIWAIPDWEIL